MQLKATVGSATETKTGVWMQAGCRTVPIDELLSFLSDFLMVATGRVLFEPAFECFQLQVFCIKNLILHALRFICTGCTLLATYRTITVSKIESGHLKKAHFKITQFQYRFVYVTPFCPSST